MHDFGTACQANQGAQQALEGGADLGGAAAFGMGRHVADALAFEQAVLAQQRDHSGDTAASARLGTQHEHFRR